MSPRTWLERIVDILICAHDIQDFTKGLSLNGFLEDPRTDEGSCPRHASRGAEALSTPSLGQDAGHPQYIGARVFSH